MTAHDTLLADWTALLRRTGGPGVADPVPYGENLLARWGGPDRGHHTIGHLAAVLGHVGELAGHVADPDPVRLAAWFHDAVHRPDRSENVERSAALAERALRQAGLPAGLTGEVARLVRVTEEHDPGPDDPGGQVLCDADLAVLATEPPGYAAYAAAVRAEYSFVPDAVFRAGRISTLSGLLARPALFRTPRAHTRWEPAARRNLTAELTLLRARDGGGRGPGLTA